MFIIAAVQEHRPAARPHACLDVSPPVTHHEAARQVDGPVSGGVQEQARARFSACAAVRVVVEADTEVVQPDAGADMGVYALDGFLPRRAARDIGLVGHPNEHKAGALEAAASLYRPLDELYLRQVGRRIGLPAADNRLIEHAIPVEEYRPPVLQRTDSHFVLFAWSAGCETMRCQMTAWKASECGVTVLGFTVGTITAQSATCAV